ncbi:hypothetical protein [Pedobacter duraquae]|uniref:Uncharacterized protein n=1 Tax=Pedobacter duraquae TaxID=425511 RepID=A0A4R6IGL1_9SPHI|nr:hypothetical protein [Pedobacter duraquae]TDO20868.1 hypothetical protein CLV32_3503 [Pedobacter duraquae]
MYDRLKNLLSPLFIVCLVLLIVNDFFLKAAFHNTLTGKLSDICGLFVFPIFWSVVFPKQKLSVFILTGVMFVFWKSEYASGLIEVLNMFNIQRTIDPTDMIALPVLLLAWFHINNRPQVLPGNSVLARLASLFIGVVTIFSFCATSQQRYVQSFDQPQYVLLQSSVIPNANLYDEFDFYKVGSLLVVKVNQVYILKPIRDDDYNKNRSIKELDQDVLERIADGVSLIPRGKITALSISTPQGTDSLRFNGGRLDGRFSRTKGGKRIIEGFYKMGQEDATWIINDSNSTNVIVQTFVNGERTSTKQFAQHKLISARKINTRADTIRNKYIQIGILVLIMVGIILLLVKNYRRNFPQQLNLKRVWKWLLCFISPIFVWLLHTGIRVLLMDFNQDIFETVATIVFIFMATCPLMCIVVFWIRLRKEMDIFLYCLLFGVLCSIWTTCGTLIELHN